MTPSELGFSINDDPKRVKIIIDSLSDEQKQELAALALYRKEYFADLRSFARQATQVALRRFEDGLELDPSVAISVEVADLAIRMTHKFSLAMAEILLFGHLLGDLPALESTRIIG